MKKEKEKIELLGLIRTKRSRHVRVKAQEKRRATQATVYYTRTRERRRAAKRDQVARMPLTITVSLQDVGETTHQDYYSCSK